MACAYNIDTANSEHVNATMLIHNSVTPRGVVDDDVAVVESDDTDE
jgi:hypothetical protein